MILIIAVQSGSVLKDGINYEGLVWADTPVDVKELCWSETKGHLLKTDGTEVVITELPAWANNAIAAFNVADANRIAVKNYPKLVAIRDMTPAQVQAWCAANITNLAQAKDAITTLAVGMSILARRL